MKSALFIATAALLLAACQHGRNAEQKNLLSGAIDLNMGRAIASAPYTRTTTTNASPAGRDRGPPSERNLKCRGWGQCDSFGG